MTERLSKNGVHVRLVGARHHRQCYRCHHILHSPQVSRLSRTSAVDQVEKKKEGIQRIQAFKVELRKKKGFTIQRMKGMNFLLQPPLLHPSPSPPATPPPPFANSLLLRYVRPEIVDKQRPHRHWFSTKQHYDNYRLCSTTASTTPRYKHVEATASHTHFVNEPLSDIFN